MIKPWRLLVAAALNVTAGIGAAAGQTVIVRHAPPGDTVEAVLNATKVGSGEVTAAGDATVPLSLSTINNTEIDANIFVDACDKLIRIIVVERTKLPDAQQPGCTRRDVPGLYWIRKVNTLVIDVSGPAPSLLLIKGGYSMSAPRQWTKSPAGLVVFGGGSYVKVRDAVTIFCGTVTTCSGKDTGIGPTAGVTYWLTPFVGAEATYMKPRNVTAQGNGETYRFNSSLDVEVATVAGKVGVPAGPVRFYGQVGMNYHRAKSLTTQTVGDASQTLEMKTKGWSWVFGGGGEVWVGPVFALYGELGFAALKGKNEAGGEGVLDDRLRFIAFGARVHIGRGR